jgi:glutathionyl-hydroquinone reductase
VRFDEIRRHYYCTHPMINPGSIVALPPVANWTEPYEREHLGDQ